MTCSMCTRLIAEETESLEANTDPQDRGSSAYVRAREAGIRRCPIHGDPAPPTFTEAEKLRLRKAGRRIARSVASIIERELGEALERMGKADDDEDGFLMDAAAEASCWMDYL